MQLTGVEEAYERGRDAVFWTEALNLSSERDQVLMIARGGEGRNGWDGLRCGGEVMDGMGWMSGWAHLIFVPPFLLGCRRFPKAAAVTGGSDTGGAGLGERIEGEWNGMDAFRVCYFFIFFCVVTFFSRSLRVWAWMSAVCRPESSCIGYINCTLFFI
jgi:hypothetical protein